MITVLSPLNRRRSTLRAALVASGLAAALAGCSATQRPEIVGSIPVDYRQTHPIVIDNKIESMDVPVAAESGKLTAAVRGNIAGFAQRFMVSDSDAIAIITPTGSPNARTAAARTLDVQDALIAAGVDRRRIQFRLYTAGPVESTAPIRIAYANIAAQTAPCGPWPDQTAHSDENRNYYNFGCATQQNLAAMVDNPLDLLYPRAITPVDATRRATVFEKYRNGSPFQGNYSSEPGGSVATGVGQ
jgi:pilus assembly protein CpaD